MRRTLMMLAILFATAHAAMAGEAADSWENLNALRPGQKIEVVDMNLKSLKGKFVSSSEQAISLRVGKDVVTVPRAGVFRVSDRETSHRARNALIGVTLGAAGGLAVGAWAGYNYHEGEKMGRIVLASVALGAGAGAAVGAAVPAGQKTIYRARERVPAQVNPTSSASDR